MIVPEQFEGLPGLTFGELIDRGTFGAVYRARHHVLAMDVAVKVIETSAMDTVGLHQTLREARLMARLDHPNLLRIFYAGQTRSAVYLVLELMEGGSLKGLRCLPPDWAVTVAKQLLSGLQALHDARILHRDIKPANCLHRPHDFRVKLADLGIAADWTSVASNDDWAGTVPFMAPELFDRPPRYSPSSDIYALGITLACLLLTADPFPSGSLPELQEWIKNGNRPKLTTERPDLPPVLARLIDRLISFRASDRPTSAAEALAALSDVDIPPSNCVPENVHKESMAAISQGTTLTPNETSRGRARIGMWELGEVIYSSPNWIGRAVNHVKTGKAARLSHLQATGAIADKSDFILAAAERASRFNHPNLVQVIDWGSRAGRAYVVTAAQGRSLEELVDEGRPLEEHMTVPFMASLADALSYLHASGFVFQLLDPGGMVVGSDARSALLTWPVFCVKIGSPNFDAEGNSQRFGVKAFAPPEVLSGSALTIEPSADIFGLGATFYYLLAGKNAYYSAWCEGKFPNVRRDSIPVTAPFACLITQLIHPDPQQRPSAQKVKQELSQIAGRLGIQLDVLSDG